MTAACWSRCLTCLLEAAFNKGRPPADVYFFSHEELVQAIKTDTTTHLEVGSINTAVKRIEKKGLVKLNSKNVTSYHSTIFCTANDFFLNKIFL